MTTLAERRVIARIVDKSLREVEAASLRKRAMAGLGPAVAARRRLGRDALSKASVNYGAIVDRVIDQAARSQDYRERAAREFIAPAGLAYGTVESAQRQREHADRLEHEERMAKSAPIPDAYGSPRARRVPF